MNRSILLSIFLVFSQIASYAQYTLTDADVTMNEDGYITACSKEFTGTETDIIIPSTLDGLTVKGVLGISGSTNFSKNMFYKKGLTSVKFPSTIESIGASTFYNNDLTSIDISECTSLRNIDYYAFAYNNLKSIDFSKCTSLEIIDWGVFSNNQLATLDLSSCSSLTSIKKFAFYTNKLVTVDLPNSLNDLGYSCFTKNAITTVNGKTHNGLFYELNDDGSSDNTVIVSYGGASKNIDFIPVKVTEISEQAFYNVDINSLDLSKLSLLSKVGPYCFQYSSIDTVDFSACKSLIYVGKDAFNITGISSFYLPTPNVAGFIDWENYSEESLTLSKEGYLAGDVRSSYTATFPEEEEEEVEVGITTLKKESFNVWPVPVKDEVHIEAVSQIQSISLFTTEGVLINEYSSNSKQVNLNLQSYQSGVVLMKIIDENGGVSVQEIIKE